MKGKFSDVLKEYVKRLSDDELRYLHIRLNQRLGGDVAEAVEVAQKNVEVDKWFALANSANDFFDMVDQLDNHIQGEVKRRFRVYTEK